MVSSNLEAARSLVRRLEGNLKRQREALQDTESQLEAARAMLENAVNPPKK